MPIDTFSAMRCRGVLLRANRHATPGNVRERAPRYLKRISIGLSYWHSRNGPLLRSFGRTTWLHVYAQATPIGVGSGGHDRVTIVKSAASMYGYFFSDVLSRSFTPRPLLLPPCTEWNSVRTVPGISANVSGSAIGTNHHSLVLFLSGSGPRLLTPATSYIIHRSPA